MRRGATAGRQLDLAAACEPGDTTWASPRRLRAGRHHLGLAPPPASRATHLGLALACEPGDT
ncbi:hypothetical protein AB0G04_02720 [Actinoplanes sp. NPDC023801]|uniref:hypothetical protein n=1 Tax=Actinoplanes sp. NPDC023801 TaxID=3154595 RepID=UPI0033F2B7B0